LIVLHPGRVQQDDAVPHVGRDDQVLQQAPQGFKIIGVK
jgi:hypothetical protein